MKNETEINNAIKKLAELEAIMPRDDKWHDLQIVNNDLFIDGKMVISRETTTDHEMIMLDRALTDNEVAALAKAPFCT